MPKRSAEKEAYWRNIFELQKKSGLSVRQFCRQQRLSEPSFYGWKRTIAQRDEAATDSKTRPAASARRTTRSTRSTRRPQASEKQPHRGRVAGAEQVDNTSAFISLHLSTSAGSVIEIVHPRGHVLRVPAAFDEGCLRQLLDLLDGQGGAAQ